MSTSVNFNYQTYNTSIFIMIIVIGLVILIMTLWLNCLSLNLMI